MNDNRDMYNDYQYSAGQGGNMQPYDNRSVGEYNPYGNNDYNNYNTNALAPFDPSYTEYSNALAPFSPQEYDSSLPVLSQEEPEPKVFNKQENDFKKKRTISKARFAKAISIIMFILSFTIVVAMTVPLSMESFELAPYYSFWTFLGTILVGVFGLVFAAIAITVTRKRSRRSIRYQTVSLLVTFFMLTGGFAVLMNVIFPDVISMATQGTKKTDDLYYRTSTELDSLALLHREFYRNNLLNGNYNGSVSAYASLTEATLDSEYRIDEFAREDVQEKFDAYMLSTDIGDIIDSLDGLKEEYFNFIYNGYIMFDYRFALNPSTKDTRQALALTIFDLTYPTYEILCEEGLTNERMEYLRSNNFNSFNHDGYNTFDDSGLLLAQQSGRMTIPVVVRLILDENYTVTQPVYDDAGEVIGYDGFLFEIYDMAESKRFVAEELGIEVEDINFNYEYEEIVDANGNKCKALKSWTSPEFDSVFGDNEWMTASNGFKISKTGIIKRPMNWCVLDMDGKNMAVVEGMSLGDSVGGIIEAALNTLPVIPHSLGGLLSDDVKGLIEIAANGASLGVQIYFDDDNAITIAIAPNNVKTGMLGYMQQNYVNSGNLLMGLVPLIGTRNILAIFGSVGFVLLLGACLLRASEEDLKKEAKRIDRETKDNVKKLAEEANMQLEEF